MKSHQFGNMHRHFQSDIFWEKLRMKSHQFGSTVSEIKFIPKATENDNVFTVQHKNNKMLYS